MGHLEKIGMTYIEHAKRSLFFAYWSIKMTAVCTIHAIAPWFFTDTFSKNVLELSKFLREENEEYKSR